MIIITEKQEKKLEQKKTKKIWGHRFVVLRFFYSTSFYLWKWKAKNHRVCTELMLIAMWFDLIVFTSPDFYVMYLLWLVYMSEEWFQITLAHNLFQKELVECELCNVEIALICLTDGKYAFKFADMYLTYELLLLWFFGIPHAEHRIECWTKRDQKKDERQETKKPFKSFEFEISREMKSVSKMFVLIDWLIDRFTIYTICGWRMMWCIFELENPYSKYNRFHFFVFFFFGIKTN